MTSATFYRTDPTDRDMIYEAKRLATFKRWKIRSGPLAAANVSTVAAVCILLLSLTTSCLM